jgi:hypothetical protein
MPLPSALIQFVEQHGCFSGCYSSSTDMPVYIAANQPPVPMISITCEDCLCHYGVLSSVLPKGMNSAQLADQLSQHVRGLRGFTLSVSGYHVNGPGFWFTALYWASCNLFLLSGEDARKHGTDLELLMLAFKHGVLKPPVPAMLDPKSFTVEEIYVNPRQLLSAIAVKSDLLKAPSVSLKPMKGWKKMTLAEFVPAPQPVATIVAPVSSAPTIGQRCPKCGAEVRQRSLLHKTYIGCMC